MTLVLEIVTECLTSHEHVVPNFQMDARFNPTWWHKGSVGEDHFADGELLSDQEDGGDTLSVYDAADIWLSNGMDHDYSFGYSEEELRQAADTD